MKICLINNLYKPYNKGGAEQVVEMIYGSFCAANIKSIIISTKPYNIANVFGRVVIDDDQVYRLNSLYYNLHRIPLIFRLFWHIWDMFDIINYFRIRKILLQERPDMIMTHNLMGISFLIPLLIKKQRIKHVHMLHDIQLLHPSGLLLWGKESALRTFEAGIYQKVNQFLFRTADIVISPSSWLLNEHSKFNFFKNSRKIVLPNPTVLGDKINVKSESGEDIFKFLYIGHLSEAKGVLLLLEAFLGMMKGGTSKRISLDLLGSNLLSAKKEFVFPLGVTAHGFVSRGKAKDFLEKADCLIMPSLCFENSPTVIYEAAAVGLPVISAKIGGATELVEDIGGILFEAGDALDLRKKMEWAIKNPTGLEKIGRKEFDEIKKYGTQKYVGALIQNVS